MVKSFVIIREIQPCRRIKCKLFCKCTYVYPCLCEGTKGTAHYKCGIKRIGMQIMVWKTKKGSKEIDDVELNWPSNKCFMHACKVIAALYSDT